MCSQKKSAAPLTNLLSADMLSLFVTLHQPVLDSSGEVLDWRNGHYVICFMRFMSLNKNMEEFFNKFNENPHTTVALALCYHSITAFGKTGLANG